MSAVGGHAKKVFDKNYSQQVDQFDKNDSLWFLKECACLLTYAGLCRQLHDVELANCLRSFSHNLLQRR